MIKIEEAEFPSAYWMEEVILGMRNPMNSWAKSDSNCCDSNYCLGDDACVLADATLILGKADQSLMAGLCKAGTDHRKFMRQMPVIVRLVAPLYWWKEFDTYKVGTVANSCSTMHKIAEKEFTLEDFSCEHLIDTCLLERVINELNIYRDIYNNYDRQTEQYKTEFSKKHIWWQMIQLLPSSYNQKRTVTLNYEVLWNIYQARKDHKLDEWREFCKWIENIPYFKDITGI